MNNQQIASEQNLQVITNAILNGETEKAKEMIKNTVEFGEMTGRLILSSLVIRDLEQAIVEAELS